MTKFLITLFFFASSFSFASASNEVIISGKISNHKQERFMILGEKFSKDITIGKKGEFKIKIDLKYVGIYSIHYSDLDFKVYLNKDSNIIITADEQNFLNSLIFKGSLSTENNYLIKKQLATSKIIGSEEDFFKLNEKDFLAKLNFWKDKVVNLYNTTKFKDAFFKTQEFKNIDYTESYYLNIFSLFHNNEEGKSDLSENYPKDKININYDFNNTDDYLFSEAYLTMIDSEWYNHIQRLIKKSIKSKIKIEIEECKKLKNEYLKGKILNTLDNKISPSNPDLDYLYDELMVIIKNDYWKKILTENYNKVKKLVKGAPSPTFNYENYDGSFTSLESLKGKYVYIDVWATWCGPCLMEIPNLEKLQNSYKDKNITFVSISIDNKVDKDKWKKMIEDKSLKGQQLFADNAWQSKFVQEYVINGIPRFILIDKEGKIIEADAPRPSDPKLIEKLLELGI